MFRMAPFGDQYEVIYFEARSFMGRKVAQKGAELRRRVVIFC